MQTPRGAYLVAKAPEWRVVLFNSEENLGMEMPFKQYLDHHARWSYGHRAGFGVPTTEDIGRVNYAGRVCEKVGVVQVSANGVVDRAQRHSNIIYYAADEPGVPQQASQILEKFIGAPLHKGVPLYIDDEVNKASDRSMLATAMPLVTLVVRTRQISDRTCSAHLFDYPSNFKKVAYEAEVRYSSKSRKDIEELLK